MAPVLNPKSGSRYFREHWWALYAGAGLAAACTFLAFFATIRGVGSALPILQPLSFLLSCMVLAGIAIYGGGRHREYRLAVQGSFLATGTVVLVAFLGVLSLTPHGFDDIGMLPFVFFVAGGVVFIMLVAVGLASVAIGRRVVYAPEPGVCPVCKYSLVGLDGNTCPECGADCTGLVIPFNRVE